MSTLHRRGGIVALGLAVAFLSSGCTSVRQEFHGRDAGHVWTAMQAVAQSPEYRDWHVMNNEVWVDPQEARLEVYRVVERSRHRAGLFGSKKPTRREWRFQIALEETDPPTARFVSRGFAIPTNASVEGKRYFNEVRKLLHGQSWELPEREPWLETRRVPEPRRVGGIDEIQHASSASDEPEVNE